MKEKKRRIVVGVLCIIIIASMILGMVVPMLAR